MSPLALLGTEFTGLVWAVCLAAFCLGFDLAVLPVAINYAAELTFPIQVSVSTGLLMMTSNVFAII